MTTTHLPIGIFDSGMGGLTVLRAIREALPHESFIYLGDTARLPYGTKSKATVEQYAVQMTRVLVERRIKALVIACNTATTAALPHLKAMLPDIPVLGVVAPGAAAAVAATRNERIAVIATETTIASNAYQSLIKEKLPKAVIETQACSVLVALAEEGMVHNDVSKAAFLHYLEKFHHEDTLLLGCTHFPVFKPLLRELLPQEVTVVDSAEATAQALQVLLKEQALLQPSSPTKKSMTQYLVTDSIERFRRVGAIFLGHAPSKDAVELVDATG